ncbi:MAG: lytic transglycosylase domain-containing protein [Pseudomonadota bacterium]
MAGIRRRPITITLLVAFALILAWDLTPLTESEAEAAFLKQGVRPGGKRLRTIKVPRPGTRRRLYNPGEQPAVKKSAGKTRRKQNYAWFWKTHSTALTAASATRWDTALTSVKDWRGKGNGFAASDDLAGIRNRFASEIAQASRKHGLSEALILAVISVESAGKQAARSHKGAQGLMQLIPATARRFGVSNAYDAGQNINGGAAYLDWLLREFNGDAMLALAGYNAGEGAVRKHKGVPPFAETRDYVVKVLDAVVASEPICGTPSGPRAQCRAPAKAAPAG